MPKLGYFPLLLFCAALFSCGGGEVCRADVVRVDSLIVSVPDDSVSLTNLINSPLDSAAIKAMFRFLGVDSLTWREVAQWRQSPAVSVFQPDVDKVYRNINDLRRVLNGIDDNSRRDSLTDTPLVYATVVWGSERPIVRVGDVVLIALNHYLGREYPGYATFAPYRRAEKRPEMLPYDVAAVVAATQYPFDADDNTTLEQWMLYEGALVEARMRLVPKARLDLALGFTPEQLEFVEEHYTEMWQEMAALKIMKSADPQVIDRYIAPSPYTPLLQGHTPGRVGRYFGYRMVQDYLKEYPGTTLPMLLKMVSGNR